MCGASCCVCALNTGPVLRGWKQASHTARVSRPKMPGTDVTAELLYLRECRLRLPSSLGASCAAQFPERRVGSEWLRLEGHEVSSVWHQVATCRRNSDLVAPLSLKERKVNFESIRLIGSSTHAQHMRSSDHLLTGSVSRTTSC